MNYFKSLVEFEDATADNISNALMPDPSTASFSSIFNSTLLVGNSNLANLVDESIRLLFKFVKQRALLNTSFKPW